jgi:hypothetical protein
MAFVHIGGQADPGAALVAAIEVNQGDNIVAVVDHQWPAPEKGALQQQDRPVVEMKIIEKRPDFVCREPDHAALLSPCGFVRFLNSRFMLADDISRTWNFTYKDKLVNRPRV